MYPLCFEPEGKVSLADVMAVMRNRFEGTEFAPDETGRTDIRVIGTDTALSVHVAQVYPSLPADRCCVTWESTGPCVYGVFVPMSNAATSVSKPYGRNQPAEDKGIFDTQRYPYYAFKELNTLCVEPDSCTVYGAPVRAYWQKVEKKLIKNMATLLEDTKELEPDEASARITDYCNRAQTQAFADAKSLLNDVRWYKSQNSNTLKNGRNPETGEVLDELKEVAPLEVTLSAKGYKL